MRYRQFKYLGVILALSVSFTGCIVDKPMILEEPVITDDDNSDVRFEIDRDVESYLKSNGYVSTRLKYNWYVVTRLKTNEYVPTSDYDKLVYQKDDGDTTIRFELPAGGLPVVVFSDNYGTSPEEQVGKIMTYTEIFLDMFDIVASEADYIKIVDTFTDFVLKPEILEVYNGNYLEYITVDDVEFGIAVNTSYKANAESLVMYTLSFRDISRN